MRFLISIPFDATSFVLLVILVLLLTAAWPSPRGRGFVAYCAGTVRAALAIPLIALALYASATVAGAILQARLTPAPAAELHAPVERPA